MVPHPTASPLTSTSILPMSLAALSATSETVQPVLPAYRLLEAICRHERQGYRLLVAIRRHGWVNRLSSEGV